MAKAGETRRAGNFGEEQRDGSESGKQATFEVAAKPKYTADEGRHGESAVCREPGAVAPATNGALGNDAAAIRYPVLLDRTPHAAKPEGREIGAITRRLQQAGPTLVTFDVLREAILAGATWCGGLYESCHGGWGDFRGQRLFGLDIDNDAEYQRRDGSRGKRPLQPDEVGYLEPTDALVRCRKLGIEPMMLYFTFSATTDPWRPKYRIVFDAGELVPTEGEARSVIRALLDAFPEADQRCCNCNRLFFGGVEVIDCRAGRWLP